MDCTCTKTSFASLLSTKGSGFETRYLAGLIWRPASAVCASCTYQRNRRMGVESTLTMVHRPTVEFPICVLRAAALCACTFITRAWNELAAERLRDEQYQCIKISSSFKSIARPTRTRLADSMGTNYSPPSLSTFLTSESPMHLRSSNKHLPSCGSQEGTHHDECPTNLASQIQTTIDTAAGTVPANYNATLPPLNIQRVANLHVWLKEGDLARLPDRLCDNTRLNVQPIPPPPSREIGAYLHAQRPDSRYSARRHRLKYLRVCETVVIASYISLDKSPRLIPRINLHPRRVITLVPQDLATRLHMEDIPCVSIDGRQILKVSG
ncbi:hypothetical protein BDN71DRAFT_1435973 [Pleurotus eryngii]|uniref:Uncharacterized protein n=1 Tax=Pleurotus eryngii TaxID=5323 RepID=A0A9P5ZLU4_PLEER|nr:hypothetical protein BDN71DRAFT_1435973 [Pleurotus eryngii]